MLSFAKGVSAKPHDFDSNEELHLLNKVFLLDYFYADLY